MRSKQFLQCTIEDLLCDPHKSYGIGIYFLYNDKDEIEYIGKSGGRSVLERLAGHVDHRTNGIMNYYLRMIAVRRRGHEWNKHKDWRDNHSDNDRKEMLIDSMP